jgi:Aldehyde dehydrogenase family
MQEITTTVGLKFLVSMIPLWTIPMAAVTGNTLIVKPSERDPGAAMIIAELCQRAGLSFIPFHIPFMIFEISPMQVYPRVS